MQLQIKKIHSALFNVEADTIGELYTKSAQHYNIADINQLIIIYNDQILEYEKTFDYYGIVDGTVCVAIVSETNNTEHIFDEERHEIFTDSEDNNDVVPPFQPDTAQQDIEQLIAMGFARELAETSYAASGGNMDMAIAMLLP